MPTLEAQAVATRVLLSLTGRRWTWPRRHVIEKYFIPETVSTINLSGRPVSGVNSAIDQNGNSYSFQLSNSFQLHFPSLDWGNYAWPIPWVSYDSQGGFWPWQRFRGVWMNVDYVYGCPPPLEVQKAIDEFAVQLDLIGSPDCQLPQRVTSVSREGVSWTVLDPMQFLTGGKTGLYYPDLIISMYGNGVKLRARVFSPEHPPPKRIFSEILDPNTNAPITPVLQVTLSQELTSQINEQISTTATLPSPYVLNQYDTVLSSLVVSVPLAASVPVGATVGFKKADSATTANTLTLDLQSTDTLNTPAGPGLLVMATGDEIVWLTSDGASIWTRVDGDRDMFDGGTF